MEGGDYGREGHDCHEYAGGQATEGVADSDRQADHAESSGFDARTERATGAEAGKGDQGEGGQRDYPRITWSAIEPEVARRDASEGIIALPGAISRFWSYSCGGEAFRM